MKVSILGGGGFLGRKVAARLAQDGKLGGKPITGLTLFDLIEPPAAERDAAALAVHQAVSESYRANYREQVERHARQFAPASA